MTNGFGGGSAGYGREITAVGGNGTIARIASRGERSKEAGSGGNRHWSSWAEAGGGDDGGYSQIFLIRLSVKKNTKIERLINKL